MTGALSHSSVFLRDGRTVLLEQQQGEAVTCALTSLIAVLTVQVAGVP